jgi:cysteine-rich repeat protein
MFKLTKLFLVLGLGAVGAFGCVAGGDSSDQEQSVAGQQYGCTLTIGYWKTHPEAWPLNAVPLGNHIYDKSDALRILNQSVQGNGLVALAHQLIAAKLNVASGADPQSVSDAIKTADYLIGALVVPPIGGGSLPTKTTSGLVAQLDSYNTGTTGPGHCGDMPPPPVCGDGQVNQTSEQCDDGNTADGDGCSATCQTEHQPACGDGHLDTNEQCDDGNLADGDGCSSRCEVEPYCGDGRLDANEDCDDGNTVDGDGCSRCQIDPYCGDGKVQDNEQCDDGNTVDGDGCSRCVLD